LGYVVGADGVNVLRIDEKERKWRRKEQDSKICLLYQWNFLNRSSAFTHFVDFRDVSPFAF